MTRHRAIDADPLFLPPGREEFEAPTRNVCLERRGRYTYIRTEGDSVGKEADTPKVRQLFIEELEQVKGGSDGPDLRRIIRELLLTTMACGEEGPC